MKIATCDRLPNWSLLQIIISTIFEKNPLSSLSVERIQLWNKLPGARVIQYGHFYEVLENYLFKKKRSSYHMKYTQSIETHFHCKSFPTRKWNNTL